MENDAAQGVTKSGGQVKNFFVIPPKRVAGVFGTKSFSRRSVEQEIRMGFFRITFEPVVQERQEAGDTESNELGGGPSAEQPTTAYRSPPQV